MGECHVKYVGATPGADTNVYVLFSTALSGIPTRGLAMAGYERVVLSLIHSNNGTLNRYKSPDGVTWTQIGTEAVTPTAGAETYREYEVAALPHFKVEWVNGGSAQSVWLVDVELDEDRLGRAFSPMALANLAGWWKADSGVTLGATLLAAGTTPPAVTISGSAATTPGLYLQIDGAGSRGVATFKASADNGSSFFATGVLTAASVPLTGALAGITAAFSVGAYATDNVYQGTVSALADLSGLGHNLAQASANQQPLFILSAQNGLPGLKFDGVNDFMSVAFANTEPNTTIVSARYDSGATGALFDGLNANRDRCYRNTATTIDVGNGGGANITLNTLTSWHGHIIVFNGASTTYRQEDNSPVTRDSGAPVVDGLTLGAVGGGVVPGAVTIGEAITYARALGAGELALSAAYQKRRYAL